MLFLPDQHLGRNTAVLELGIPLEECAVYDPRRPGGGLTAEQLRNAKMLLWKGHCSVHGRFTLDSVNEVRARVPGVKVLVHPECQHEVVQAADLVGSTEFILRTLAAGSEPGSAWAVGTELNLVRRLAAEHPDKTVVFLDRTVCFCSTMNGSICRTWCGRWSRLPPGSWSTASPWIPLPQRTPGRHSIAC